MGLKDDLLGDVWSYWEIDRAIGRFVSFSFFARGRLWYLDMDGAIRRWMMILGKLYHSNKSRSVEDIHSVEACGMLG